MRVGEGAVEMVEDGKQAVERVSREGELPVSPWPGGDSMPVQ